MARIYGEGIATGAATFEHTVPTWEQWQSARAPDLCLLARGHPSEAPNGAPSLASGSPAGGSPASGSPASGSPAGGDHGTHAVLGWVALSRVSSREVYRGVGEIGIYVDQRHARRGVGRALLGALVERSEQLGFWMLQAGIFPDNEASVALHRSCGFRLVGVRERVGRTIDGRWRDVALYERRSDVVGV
jgi:phosphinothricin acetyltransferase